MVLKAYESSSAAAADAPLPPAELEAALAAAARAMGADDHCAKLTATRALGGGGGGGDGGGSGGGGGGGGRGGGGGAGGGGGGGGGDLGERARAEYRELQAETLRPLREAAALGLEAVHLSFRLQAVARMTGAYVRQPTAADAAADAATTVLYKREPLSTAATAGGQGKDDEGGEGGGGGGGGGGGKGSGCGCGAHYLYRIASKGAWYAGSTPGSDVAAAVCYDDAPTPERIASSWRVYDGSAWVPSSVLILSARARA